MMSEKQADLLEVGVVSGTHGLRGDLKISTLPTGELALPGAGSVYLKDSKGVLTRYDTVRSTPHKKHILLRLSGMESLASVEGLIGTSVWMEQGDLPELADDQFFWSDLEGLDVVDRQEGKLGQVVGMFTTPAHDILEVDGPKGEILIPVVEPFLVDIDHESGILHVDLPEGLVPETE